MRPRTAQCRDEGGAVTVFFVLLVVAMVLVAGLVYDGGRLLAARRQAQDAAQDAARAGAQALDIAAVRSGTTTLAPADAAAAARAWLASEGASGSVSVAGDTVSVSVQQPVRLALLALAGVSTRTVRAEASARIVEGVTGAES